MYKLSFLEEGAGRWTNSSYGEVTKSSTAFDTSMTSSTFFMG